MSIFLAPRPVLWISSLQAACFITCFLVAATPLVRVSTARPTSSQGIPVWLIWRKRPMVRKGEPSQTSKDGRKEA